MNALGVALGLLATSLVVALQLDGRLDWAELRSFDLRMRYFNRMPVTADPPIRCIDIDDGSLATVGKRWPWPRDEQAGMFSLLGELGARAVLLDITYNEPEPLRSDAPLDADVVSDPQDLLAAELAWRLPDAALHAALSAGRNVYLAVHYNEEDWDYSAQFDHIIAARRDKDLAPDEIASRFSVSLMRARELYDAARVVELLREQPAAGEADVAARLGLGARRLRGLWPHCLQYALRERIGELIRERPELRDRAPYAAFVQIYASIPGLPPIENQTEVRLALASALRTVRGYEATLAHPLVDPARVRDACVPAVAIVPVYFRAALAARRCGFVAFDPDSDGIMRRTALLATHGDFVLPQLAFAVACDVMKLEPADISASAREVVLHRRLGGDLHIPLDGQRRALVPWLPDRNWTSQFGEHIPVDVLWTVQARRRELIENVVTARQLRRNFFSSDLFPANADYRQAVAETAELERADKIAAFAGDNRSEQAAAKQLAERNAFLDLYEQSLLAALQGQPAPPGAPHVSHAPDEFLANQALAAMQPAEQARGVATRLQGEIDDAIAWLRPRIAGHICVVGYTATSVADMVPTPTSRRTPGVAAHANLLNALLTGQTISAVPLPVSTAIAFVFGLLAAVASTYLRPRAGILLLLTLLVAYTGVALLAFRQAHYWLSLAPVMLAALLSYFTGLVYRYIFIERERRQLTTALSQYTSATLARQMAENEDLCRRAEEREVTTIFTDLAGFTSISERIGAERTQRVLNVALGRFSEAMLRHEAMINKFIGDGIFAFWNPVIYPQPDHARRACETAIDLFDALGELKESQKRGGGDPAFADLALRVGVATGNAVVGPCGSQDKYDYTCIGDSVNVASRLESANKFFGTRALVSGATRAQANGDFVFRSLGGVQVKGKTQAVPIFELLGRSGDVSADDLRYAEEFGEAVRFFQNRDFRDACAAFARLAEQRPGDAAAGAYRVVAQRYAELPPPADWNGGLELTEK